MYNYQIGISYADEQKKIAERIFNLLTEKGIKVFFAPNEESNYLGLNIYTELINIYENECKYIVAIISEEYLNKDYTNQELSVALTRNKNGEKCLIPIYTSDARHKDISSDTFYIDYSKKKEPIIVNDILQLLNYNQMETDINDTKSFNAELESDSSLLKISRDYKIFISGATGVGKSTIARNILTIVPEFVIIEEADMLREAVRGENDRIIQIISEYANQKNKGKAFGKESLKNLLNYDILKKSTVDLNNTELNTQCKLILEPLEKVCFRLMDKGMPAIIEGVNLSFEAMFEEENSFYSTSLDSSDTLFLNLYISDESIHKERLILRSNDRRENAETRQRYLKKLSNIRDTNNYLYTKTEEYSRRYKNVYNIDTNESVEKTVKKIIDIMKGNK